MRNALWAAAILALAVPALSLVGCQPVGEPETAAPAAEPTDEELLHQLAADFEKAWGAADATAVAALWTEDGDSLSQTGHHKGRAAVEESYRQSFEGPFKGTTVDIEMTSVRFLQPDLAIADGTYVVSGAEGVDVPGGNGQWTNVNMKVGDQWLIACSRPMIPQEAPAAD
jgi:uncharacterized protein (TIGR02246 family)